MLCLAVTSERALPTFQREERMFSSIRTAMLLLVGGVVIVIQSLLVGVVVKLSHDSSLEVRTHEMYLMAQTISKSLSDFGQQQAMLVRGVAKAPRVKDFLLTGEGLEGAATFLSVMSQASSDVNTLYLFDKRGKQAIIRAQGKEGKLSDLADREYVQAALAGKDGFSSSAIRSYATGKLIVSVTAPVRDDNGNVIGGVGMSYDIEGLMKNYIESIKLGSTGYPFIISPEGVIIGHPDSDLILKNLAAERGIADMLKSPSGRDLIYKNPSGQTRTLAWASVPRWNWIVGVTMTTAEIEAPSLEQRNIMLLIGGIAVAALILITLVALDRIAVRPLRQLQGYAAEVAEGRLDNTLLLRSRNEIGRLAENLRTMVASLKDMIAHADEKTSMAKLESDRAAQATAEAQKARAAAERARVEGMLHAASRLEGVVTAITDASGALSAQVDQASRGAEQQSARASETATAMEEMNSTVTEVARNAAEAATSADHARSRATDGANVVSEAISGIGHAQEQASELKENMTALGKQAESTGQILGVISDIADQTNLLALNAAIEAARAGEAGRGFAVVADEVRKLAEKTMNATREVGAAITEIQNGTRKNVDHVEQVVNRINEATTLSGTSGAALREIVSLVEETSHQVRSIATAAEQQSATSEEINRSVDEVNRISYETSEAMRLSASSVAELARQSQVLRELIERMKNEGRG